MKRTDPQNNALHLFCERLAQELNDKGLDMRHTLKEDIDIPWTKENVKNFLWRPIQIAMTDKQSTTELTSGEPSRIHEVLSKHLGEKFGIYIPFPSDEEK